MDTILHVLAGAALTGSVVFGLMALGGPRARLGWILSWVCPTAVLFGLQVTGALSERTMSYLAGGLGVFLIAILLVRAISNDLADGELPSWALAFLTVVILYAAAAW